MYTYNTDPNKVSKQFKKYSHFLITLRGVFLALLLFCASFLAPYVGCSYQSILKSNILYRYFFLFLVIYFSINLVDPDTETLENPIYSLIKSVFVFGIFLLLDTIDASAIAITLVLFTLLIITSKYHNYYSNISQNPDDSKLVVLNITQIAISVCIIILLSISSTFAWTGNVSKKGKQSLQKCL